MSDIEIGRARRKLSEAMGVYPGNWDDVILMLNAATRIERLQSETSVLLTKNELLQKKYRAFYEAAEKFLFVFFVTLDNLPREVIQQVRTPALVEAHKALNALVVAHEFDEQEEQEGP